MPSNAERPSRLWPRLGVLAALVLLVGFFWWRWGDVLTLDALVRQEQSLRVGYARQPALVLAGAFAAYVLVCALALPGAATALTLLFGWLFGFWIAAPLVSFASTAGASLAFLLSRYLFRDVFENRFGARVGAVQRAIEREGAFYLLLMRMSPLVPFYLINVLMGLTTLRLTTFWWVSQLGMLPATCIYVYTGSTVPSLTTLAEQGIQSILTVPLVLGLTLLGVFPLVMKKIAARWVKSRNV